MRDAASISRFSATRNWKARGEQVTSSLRAKASSTQQSLQAFLRGRNIPFKSFWIANTLRVTAEPGLIAEIARRPDVAQILPDSHFAIPPLAARTASTSTEPTIEWGLSNIRAPEVWDRFGAQGDGIVVANIDTGVQFDHPALVHQYRGNRGDHFEHAYNWYDPAAACGPASDGPCDNVDHGTHTMGTMVGDDLAGNVIGVAPHARWIAAKGCSGSVCSNDSLLSAGEWLLAPTDLNGENPRPDLRPNIINNSWTGELHDPFYRAVVQAWRAAGIFAVFSSGNTGQFGCRTIGSPAD
jgi:subtilisin family serine protease